MVEQPGRLGGGGPPGWELWAGANCSGSSIPSGRASGHPFRLLRLVAVFSFAPSKLGLGAARLGSSGLCSVPAPLLSRCSAVPGGPWGGCGLRVCVGQGQLQGEVGDALGRAGGQPWGGGSGGTLGAAGVGEGDLELQESINTVSMATVQQKLFPP